MTVTLEARNTSEPSRKSVLSLFGGPRDFERSVRDELGVLYRVAVRMGCRADEAEDLVQQTLLKAYQAWSRFDGMHLRSWLIRILRNERLMNLRVSKTTLSLDDEDNGIDVASDTLWDTLSLQLDASAILDAMERLPENYRVAIQLCDVEQMTYDQAAAALDVPVGTIRSRLFRARNQLRELLAGQGVVE